MEARLTLYFHNAPAREVQLDQSREYILGRSSLCDISIDSIEASRRHARVAYIDDRWQIEDLDSKNGVAVDGEAVATARLERDCWVGLGQLLIRFDLRTAEQAESDIRNQRVRYETAIEIRRSLSPSAGVEPLLKKLLASTVQLVGLERGFAMLARPDGDMEVICTTGVDGAEATVFRGSVGAINHALDSQKSVVSMDVQQFVPLADRPSIVAGQIKALVCLPMSIMERTIGMIYADSQSVAKILTDLDLEILEGLIGHATTALAVAQLDKEIVDINSILNRGEIDVARLSHWQDSLPGYRQPLPGSADTATDNTRLTWSKVAATGR